MSKVKTELYKANCKSHFCNHCGRKLRAKMSKGEIAFLLGLFGIYMLVLLGVTAWQERLEEKPTCYAKQLVRVGDNKFEYWTNHEVDCDWLNQLNK